MLDKSKGRAVPAAFQAPPAPAPDWRLPLAQTLRVARGTESQSALGARAGVSDRTISMIELGNLEKLPRVETVARLALATRNDPQEWLSLVGLACDASQEATLRQRMPLSDRAAATAHDAILVRIDTTLTEQQHTILDLQEQIDQLRRERRVRRLRCPSLARRSCRRRHRLARPQNHDPSI